MLIKKFQHQQEKAKGGVEWAWRNEDIRDVHSSSIAGKKGLSCQQQRIVQSAMGLTTTIAHLRGFASMIEDI
jgi:hypothetical protein